MTQVDFVKYVAILRNVRACLLATDDFPPSEQAVSWLKRHIRWRPVGAPLSVLGKLGDLGKRLLALVFPTNALEEFCELLSSALPRPIAESLTLASCYVVPILILNRGLVKTLREKNLILHAVMTSKSDAEVDLKLHMRIAEYSIKDAHFELIERARKRILAGELPELLRERKEFCQRDAKRYWRVSEERGREFLLYLDPLLALRGRVEDLKNLLEKDRSVTLALGIVPALVL